MKIEDTQIVINSKIKKEFHIWALKNDFRSLKSALEQAIKCFMETYKK